MWENEQVDVAVIGEAVTEDIRTVEIKNSKANRKWTELTWFKLSTNINQPHNEPKLVELDTLFHHRITLTWARLKQSHVAPTYLTEHLGDHWHHIKMSFNSTTKVRRAAAQTNNGWTILREGSQGSWCLEGCTYLYRNRVRSQVNNKTQL